jgi:hypothetical protein
LYGWTFGGPAGVRLGLERTVAIGVLHQAVVAPKVHLGVVRHVVVVLIVLAVDEAVTVRVAVELVSDEERDANRDGLSNLVHGHFLTQAAWDGSPAKCKSGVTGGRATTATTTGRSAAARSPSHGRAAARQAPELCVPASRRVCPEHRGLAFVPLSAR